MIAAAGTNHHSAAFLLLVSNRQSMKMSVSIDQLPYAKKLATLTQLYLELSLPLENSLRAAEADLCHI